MGACGEAEDMSVKKNSKLFIYGDYFSSDTRAMIIACKFAEVDHELKLVNTLKQENLA